MKFGGPLRFSTHRVGEGEAYFKHACERGWEGLVAKRADSPYKSTRSRDWLKIKCGHEQELVIGGWTDPKGSRTWFGALLVGYWEKGKLRYAGKVGTGFNGATPFPSAPFSSMQEAYRSPIFCITGDRPGSAAEAFSRIPFSTVRLYSCSSRPRP